MTTAPALVDTPVSVSDGQFPWLRFVGPLLWLTLLIGALGVAAYRYLGEEVRDDTDRTLAVIAEQKRTQIEDVLEAARADARLHFASHSQFEILFSQWLKSGRRDDYLLDRIRSRLVDVAKIRDWGGALIYDAEAGLTLAIGDASLPNEQARVLDILRRPRIELVDLHIDATGKANYGILTPIGRSGQKPLGVAYLSWRAENTLYPRVKSWPVPTQTAETYLVRREGEEVRFVTPLRHLDAPLLDLVRPMSRHDLPAARAAGGEYGILSGGRDYRNIPVLAYAVPVAGTPWLMLAEIDEVEAYAEIRAMALETALLVGLGLLLIYSCGFLLWRRAGQNRELEVLHAQQAAEARFRVVFEQAPMGIVLLDVNSGRITETNQRFAEIVGRSPDAVIGMVPSHFTHPDDQAESRMQLERMRAGENNGYSLNKRYIRPDGTEVWASLTCSPVELGSTLPPRFLFIIQDISERYRYEAALRSAHDAAEAANAAKSEFLAHMSHEIRTPMNAVLGLAQVLEREPLADNQRDMVTRIRRAGESLLNILNDVLDLSKIEAGQLRIEPRPFQLARLLADVDSLMGQAANAKALSLRIVEPDLGPVDLMGDGLRLEQVLLNLIGNAIKFTERGEVALIVTCRERNDAALRLRFEVRDSGIGISPDALEKLFVSFVQADAGISRRYGGTGLGLSICKRLVEMMGGQIGANSEQGLGSCFWFEVPLLLTDTQPAERAAEKTARARTPSLPGAHLLVVDDSAMNRDMVERALAQEGASVTLAADGQQAVQILKGRPDAFDCVLMDVQMPVMDGLTAIRLIRQDLGMRELPIIAFTAGVRAEQQAAASEAGANDVLPKPMDLDEMVEILTRWIQSRAPLASAAAVAAPTDEFPDIPGIDRERAGKRLGQDRAMFVSLLNFFCEDNAHVVAQVRADLAAGDREAAGRRMHTLGSNAGFLCAFDLMEAARSVELAIAEDETTLTEALDAIEAHIAGLIEASKPWRDAESSDHG